uniref:Uncharacterized protein n=1 Tax=Anguilla anguilla TaxID=7936 RepID=A0A0E9VKD9_ANGAN
MIDNTLLDSTRCFRTTPTMHIKVSSFETVELDILFNNCRATQSQLRTVTNTPQHKNKTIT